MIGTLLMAQAMIETLDTRPQRAVPATAFRCTFIRADLATGETSRSDLYGTIPEMPEGHLPDDSFPVQLGSTDASPLARWGMANNTHQSDWLRDYQISTNVDGDSWVIHLMLRREGRSIAYLTRYNSAWESGPNDRFEPFRYDAVGLCAANFMPKEQG